MTGAGRIPQDVLRMAKDLFSITVPCGQQRIVAAHGTNKARIKVIP